MKMQAMIDRYVRDVTKVHPMPKSKARRRLDSILKAQLKEMLKECDRKENEGGRLLITEFMEKNDQR